MYALNSSPCVTRDGKPRKAYRNWASADDGADYVYERYKNRVVPYECELCGDWHLCPA